MSRSATCAHMSTADYAVHRGCSDSYVRRLRRTERVALCGHGEIDVAMTDILLAGAHHSLRDGGRSAICSHMDTADYATHRGWSDSYVRRLRRNARVALCIHGEIDVAATDTLLAGAQRPLSGGQTPGGDNQLAAAFRSKGPLARSMSEPHSDAAKVPRETKSADGFNTAWALDMAFADLEREQVGEIETLARIGLPADHSARVAQRIGDRLTLWAYGPLRSNLSHLHSAISDNADASEVIVRIDSPGGLFVPTLDLARALAVHPGRKVAIVDRRCWSAAVLVSVACDCALVRSNATVMIHLTRHHAAGDSDELMRAVVRARIADLDYQSFLSNRRNISRELVNELMPKEHYMCANEAVALGFADCVITALPTARSRSVR